jgi:hypothetical protein
MNIRKLLVASVVLAVPASITIATGVADAAVYTNGGCTFSITHSGNQAAAVDLFNACYLVQSRVTVHIDGSNTTYFGAPDAVQSVVNGGAGTYVGSSGRAQETSVSVWSAWLPG